MTFEAEWAELKRESSARRNQLNLASAGGAGGSSGGGQGDIRSSQQVWNKAAGAVGSLHTNLRTTLRDLAGRQPGAAGGGSSLEGLQSAASHHAAYQSWQRRLDLLSRECGELQDKMQKTGSAFYKSDAATKEAFQQQTVKPTKNPPASPSASPSAQGKGTP